MVAARGTPTTDSWSMSIVPASPAPTRCERVSSTTARAGALGAALDAGADGNAAEGDCGTLEVGAGPLDVPVLGVVAAGAEDSEEAEDAVVEVIACFVVEVHAVAKVASAISATARRQRRDVSTQLL